ncbi:hypothetical protein AK812_SmicGene17279 [Symbiodinium microadriaticum]|uniref:Uncharacterized protein n=1 Tax=Symbiodinium microadriaticum TaxID=2951 RepID=A0A1Q9DY55_SYMMI|nr:hypothetical protein AK812_SmicGene17279 [Symbiodinium microadriaticum]
MTITLTVTITIAITIAIVIVIIIIIIIITTITIITIITILNLYYNQAPSRCCFETRMSTSGASAACSASAESPRPEHYGPLLALRANEVDGLKASNTANSRGRRAGTCHWSLSVSEGIITTACFTFLAAPVPAAVMAPIAAVCTSFHQPSAHFLFSLERSAPSHFGTVASNRASIREGSTAVRN